MDALVETILRGWHGFLARPSGPLSARFVIQPTLASLLAMRAGIEDARAGRPPFLWAAVTDRAHRRALLWAAAKDLRVPIALGTTLDVVYQVIVNRGVYALELAFTVVLLAVVPYVVLRGPVNRVARAVRGR